MRNIVLLIFLFTTLLSSFQAIGQCNYSVSNQTPCANTVVNFSIDTPSGIYGWDFTGDSIPEVYGANIGYIFPNTAVNQYRSITVFQNGVACYTDSLFVLPTPDPSIGVIPGSGILNGNQIRVCSGSPDVELSIFNATTTFSTNTSYEISWGDGIVESFDNNSFSNTSVISHNYSVFGYYTIVVSATGTNNCTSSKSYLFYNGGNPSVGLANPGNTVGLCTPATITFPITNTANNPEGTIYNIYVAGELVASYGQGTLPANFVYTFTETSCGITTSTGNYENAYDVQIEATNPCGSSQATIEPIELSSPPEPIFTIEEPQNGCLQTPFVFTNSSTGINEVISGFPSTCESSLSASWSITPGVPGVHWNILDGNLFDSEELIVEFLIPGNYVIEMTMVSDACGVYNTSQALAIEAPPTINTTLDLQSAAAPALSDDCIDTYLALTSTVDGDNTNTRWYISPSSGWEYADDTNFYTDDLNILFTNPGSYYVTLLADNSCASAQWDTTIIIKDLPLLSLTPLPDVCESTILDFDEFSVSYDANGGQFDTFLWSFEGATPSSSTEQFPSNIAYNNPGEYIVQLTASNECGSTTVQDTFIIQSLDSLDLGDDLSLCADEPSYQLTASVDGGTWSGPGVDANGLFQPSEQLIGQHTIYYSYQNQFCFIQDSLQIEVTTIPTVDAGADINICIDADPLLINDGTPTGGIWSIDNNGVLTANNVFDPQLSGIGNYQLLYSYEDANGCTNTDFKTITVNPLPVVNAGNDVSICESPNDYQLSDFAPAGGSWSGPGVDPNGVFNAQGTNGIGSYTLFYNYTDPTTDCTNLDSLVLTITPNEPAEAGEDEVVCLNDGPFTINTGTPMGGTWSGPGVNNNIFNPTDAGVGRHLLHYSIGTGICATTDSKFIRVDPLPNLSLPNDQELCIDSEPYDLDIVNPQGGTWSGIAIQNDQFHPQIAGVGTHTLIYHYTDPTTQCEASASFDIEILELPMILVNDTVYCNTPGNINLPTAQPAGGSWSGPGVINNQFNPQLAGGVGSYTLSYSYTNNIGCENEEEVNITVIQADIIDAGNDRTICINHPTIDLSAGITPQGGTWIANGSDGLYGNIFHPDEAGVGTHILSYYIGDDNCQVSDNITITITALPNVLAGQDISVCVNELAIPLQASPQGGIWDISNGGVINNNEFYPTESGVGVYHLTYYYEDEQNCEGMDDVIITVLELPIVVAHDTSYCLSDGNFELPSAYPTGGTWSGLGISGNLFNPTTAGGVGVHEVFYNYQSSMTNCSKTDTAYITVIDPLEIDAGPDEIICIDNGLYELSNYTPTSGTWSGTGIVDTENGIFDPSIAGAGIHLISYEIGSGSCQNSDQKTIEVIDLSEVSAGEDEQLCLTDTAFILTGQNPVGGSWSGPGITNATIGVFDPSVAGTGIHTITYHYEDAYSSCQIIKNKTIEIFPMEPANFNLPEVTCVNSPVSITTTQPYVNYQLYWDFGDGQQSEEFHPIHVYTDTGTYTVSLVIENQLGCKDSITHDILVVEAPTAYFELDTTEACVELEVGVDNQSYGYDISYTWDLGNGSYLEGENPNLLYFQDGLFDTTYVISLEVNNICGQDIHSESILIHPKPVVDFGVLPESTCTPMTINFANVTVGSATEYLWDFGNGHTSTDSLPDSQVYTTDSLTSYYDITLVGSNFCGTDTAQQTIEVPPPNVTAFFNTSTIDGCVPLMVELYNYATPGATVDWDFGDGNSSSLPEPIHTFQEPGEYMITQFASSDCGYDTTQLSITVHPQPEVRFNHAPTICAGQAITFDNQSINTSGNFWDFGDGTSSTASAPEHIFNEPGVYYITLTGVSMFNQCEADYTSELIVLDLPQASFIPSITNGCIPLDVQFENTSTESSLFYEWDFGDGNSSIDENPTHQFEEVGNYEISLIATDANGCFNDTTAFNIIVHPFPIADFDFDNTTQCGLPANIEFQNLSEGATSYEWSFGDDQNSIYNTPTHQYQEEGDYELELVATNQFGCKDSSDQIIHILPQPVASIDIQSFEGCSPVEVAFTNQSINTNSYTWNFGDGNSSNESNPSHLYEEEGVYTVEFIASLNDICFDTMRLNSKVKVYASPVASFEPVEIDNGTHSGTYEMVNYSEHADYYFWDFGDGTTSEDFQPTHRYVNNGVRQVYLETSTEYGCVDDTLITMTPTFFKGLYIPNGFSPEQGIGDVRLFKPKGVGIKEYHIQVFSTYGQLLWESRALKDGQPAEAWDGTVDGRLQPQDVYVWKASAIFYDGSVWKGEKGNSDKYKTIGSVILLR